MRIKNIYVDNFKSLVDFRIDLAKFNCLVGLNGSGKSTFLQFIDFLSQLMKGKMNEWLSKRELTKDCLPFYRDNKSERINFKLSFSHHFDDGSETPGYWESEYWTSGSYCLKETLKIGQYEFQSKNYSNIPKEYILQDEDQNKIVEGKINFNYEGSIFSQLEDEAIPGEFKLFKETLDSIQMFGQLMPYQLKKNIKENFCSIGYEGEHLSAFVHQLSDKKRAGVTRKLKEVYPSFGFFKSNILEDQSKELMIGDVFHHGNLTYQTSARYINDGLLRVIAFLSEIESRDQVLLFDEIENGINPELIGFLLKEFINSDKQIVVTTHSPLVLNYLDDETAIPGVHFFYKTPEGHTRTVPFLSIPAMKEKLEVMGPGEAFIDTNLLELSRELSESDATPEKEG